MRGYFGKPADFSIFNPAHMKESTIIYRSFFEAIKDLPKDSQANLWTAICEYSFNQNITELEGIDKTVFTLIKPQLDANNIRWENGCKGGRPKTKPKPKDNQTETKPIPNANHNHNHNHNHNENVNENENIIFDNADDKKNDKEKKGGNPPEEPPPKINKSNDEITKLLLALKTTIGIQDFRDSQKYQRFFGNHLLNLLYSIGQDAFKHRLEIILKDSFKQKNCNNIQYLYKELKGFIEPKVKAGIIKVC